MRWYKKVFTKIADTFATPKKRAARKRMRAQKALFDPNVFVTPPPKRKPVARPQRTRTPYAPKRRRGFSPVVDLMDYGNLAQSDIDSMMSRQTEFEDLYLHWVHGRSHSTRYQGQIDFWNAVSEFGYTPDDTELRPWWKSFRENYMSVGGI